MAWRRLQPSGQPQAFMPQTAGAQSAAACASSRCRRCQLGGYAAYAVPREKPLRLAMCCSGACQPTDAQYVDLPKFRHECGSVVKLGSKVRIAPPCACEMITAWYRENASNSAVVMRQTSTQGTGPRSLSVTHFLQAWLAGTRQWHHSHFGRPHAGRAAQLAALTWS